MADQQPQKSDSPSSGSKSGNRRYFRRRRKGGASAEGQAAPAASQGKEQSRPPADPKPQGSRPPEQRGGEQQEKQRKRRRSNNNSNRRSSSSRRQRREEQANIAQTAAPDLPERYREPMDVYVHTHIVRPAYRDTGSDYVSEKSFLAERRVPEASIHMDRLEEDIRKQLDEYLNRPVVPVKVIREAGDEDWDDEGEG